MKEDQVDRIRRESNLPRRGEDVVEIVGRVFRYCAHLEQRVGVAFASAGLNRAEADLLSALRRSSQPKVPPSRLASQLICSTGTMTNRLDRLEKMGFVRRHDDPNDRRGVLIELTDRGRKAIAKAAAARDAMDAELIPALSLPERRQLTNLLRKLLIAFEEPHTSVTRKSSKPKTKRTLAGR